MSNWTINKGKAAMRRFVASKLLSLFLMLGLFAVQAVINPYETQAAITQPGAWTQAYSGTASTTGNFSYTAASGSSRIVAVAVYTAYASNTVATPTTITFGGTTLTVGRSDAATSMRQHTMFYYLPEASIPAGAANLVVTVPGTVQRLFVYIATFAGVDQTTTIDSSQNSNRNTDGTTAVFSTALTINANCQAVLLTNLYNHTDSQGAAFGTDPPSGFSAASASYSDNTTNSKAFRLNNYGSIPSSTVTTTASHGSCSPGTLGFSMTGVSLRASSSSGNLTVGNGTNPSNATVYTGSTGNAIDSFTLAMSTGTATVSTLTLTGSTNFTSTNVANIHIYSDDSAPQGSIGGTDAEVPTTYTLSGNVATITFTTPEVVSTSAQNFLVVVDIKPGGTSGNTLTATITGATGTGIGTPTYSDSASATLTLATGTTTIGQGTNPANANPAPGSTGNALNAFTLVKSAGSGTVSTITFLGSSQFTSSNVSSVKLYRDTGATIGALDASDVLIATTTSWSTNTATLTLTTPETVTTSAVNYLIVVDIASGATVGNTLSGTVSALSGTGLGTVTDNDTSSATLTITSAGNLSVGNGATISNANAQQGSTGIIMDSFTLVMSSGSGTVNTLTLTGSTNFTSTNVANIHIYSDDSNPQGSIGGSDAEIPTTYTLSGNVATITFTTPETVTTTTQNFLVTVDIKSTATVGNTLSGTVTAATGTSLGTPTYSDTASGTLTVTAGTCVRSAPSAVFSPISASIPQGNNLGYTLMITNNDNIFCSASTFTIAIGGESGNTANFVLPSTLGSTTTGALSYGATYNTSLTVTTQSAGTVGSTNTTTVNVTDATNHGSIPGSGSVVSTVSLYSYDMSTLHNANRFGTCSMTEYSGTSEATCSAMGGTWTATSKWSGNWGLSGGKYGPFDCTTCHMIGATNIKRVKSSFATPDSTRWASNNSTTVAVTFTNVTSLARGMGDDTRSPSTSSTHVCEVCHNQNKYHNYNTANNTGGTSHYNGKDCTGCHPHRSGFLGSAHDVPYYGYLHDSVAGTSPFSSCTGCHTNTDNTSYPFPQAVGVAPDCQACHTKASPIGNTTNGCHSCHGSSGQSGNNIGRPSGSAYPDRVGRHSNISEHVAACTTCHDISASSGFGTGNARHGWANRKKTYLTYSSVKRKLSVYNVNAARTGSSTRNSGDGTCSGNVGCCSSHGSSAWY